jgi:hypothetical protein
MAHGCFDEETAFNPAPSGREEKAMHIGLFIPRHMDVFESKARVVTFAATLTKEGGKSE